MNDSDFIKNYLSLYKQTLFSTNVEKEIESLKELLIKVKNNDKKVLIAGNGGSAALSSHVSVDFTKLMG